MNYRNKRNRSDSFERRVREYERDDRVLVGDTLY